MSGSHFVLLNATSAVEARREIASKWPKYNVTFRGYDTSGEVVSISLVRKQGEKGNVATATRGIKPVKFIAEIPQEVRNDGVASV